MTTDAAVERARAWVADQVTTGEIPQAVLGIATSSGIAHLEAFGGIPDRPAHVDDVYPLFSITKPVVTLAALRAVDAGVLALDAPLSDALPEFGRNRDDVVRLHHLLSHTAGFAEPPLAPDVDLTSALLRAEQIFAAGRMSAYSSIAFEGVRLQLEAATGKKLAALIAELGSGAEELRFAPLGDATTVVPVVGVVDAGLDVARLARLEHPGAGLAGRAEPLLRIAAGLLADDGRFASPSLLGAARISRTDGLPRLHPYPAERGQDWGWGWNLLRRVPGLPRADVYGHAGWAGGQFWVSPELDRALVLLTNRAALPLDVGPLVRTVMT